MVDLLTCFRPRLIKDPDEVDAVLKSKLWQMAGPVKRMLGPLLGNGIILATGDDHTQKRRTIGKHLTTSRVEAVVDNYVPPFGIFDIGDEMLTLSAKIVAAALDVEVPPTVPRLVRRCVQLAPGRLLGLPLDAWHLRRLDAALANVPLPSWLQGVDEKTGRDWITNLFVAGIDTMSADMTAQLIGVDILPIWWLPRRHVETGQLVILLLSPRHRFGGGFRRCVGEPIAKTAAARLRQRFRVIVNEVSSDLRETGLITRRLRRVVGEMRLL